MRSPTTLTLTILANLVFWPALFGFAAARPGYSHFTNAISDLGAFDAPHMWAWNVVGFMVPGVLLAIAGWQIGRRIESRHVVTATLLAFSGAMLVLTGLAPADLTEPHGAATTIHVVSADSSLVAWGFALALLAAGIRRRHATSLVALAALASVAAILLFADHRFLGLTQRLLFAAFFISFPALDWAAPRRAL